MKSIFLKNNESEINKKSVIKNKDTTDYILINKLFKLMINSDYSNFTKHLLYKSGSLFNETVQKIFTFMNYMKTMIPKQEKQN